MGDGGGLVGCRAALASRRLMPEPISSSHGTARLAPSISSLTSSRDRDAAAANVSVIRWARRKFKDGIGLVAFVGRTGIFLRTGSYAMATAEHREPCDSAYPAGKPALRPPANPGEKTDPDPPFGMVRPHAPHQVAYAITWARENYYLTHPAGVPAAHQDGGKRASWQSS